MPEFCRGPFPATRMRRVRRLGAAEPTPTGGEGGATKNALLAFGRPEGEEEDASHLDATMIDDFLLVVSLHSAC